MIILIHPIKIKHSLPYTHRRVFESTSFKLNFYLRQAQIFRLVI